jgi:hypothetical protein
VVYKVARTLTSEDAAYLAGLIDGEGTISLSRRHATERRQLVVSISSTERALVDWAERATGVGKVTRKRTSSEKHAPGLTYSVSNRQALALLEQVIPYLRSYKKFRARLVLDQYVALTPRNGKYSAALSASREAFERAFLNVTAGQPGRTADQFARDPLIPPDPDQAVAASACGSHGRSPTRLS